MTTPANNPTDVNCHCSSRSLSASMLNDHMPNGQSPAVFTPYNEPYVGSKALMRFDLAIVEAMKANQAVARGSHQGPLTPLQLAACEIIPQAISISLSIRELIRQGY